MVIIHLIKVGFTLFIAVSILFAFLPRSGHTRSQYEYVLLYRHSAFSKHFLLVFYVVAINRSILLLDFDGILVKNFGGT